MSVSIRHQRTEKYFTAFLCCAFFSLNALALNPAYIFGAGLLLIILLFITTKASISKFSFVTLIFGFLILISQLVGIMYKLRTTGYPDGPNYITPMLFFYSMLISIGVNETFAHLAKASRIRCYKTFLKIFVIFMSLELITRIIIGDYSQGLLYAFKKSIFYFDSNFTSLVDIAVIGFVFFLKNYENKDFKGYRYLIYFFLILTMSRAAIVTLLVMLFVFNKKNQIKIRSLVVLFAILIVFILMSLSYLAGDNYSNIDGSFNSKFYIIKEAINFYETQPFIVNSFGVGLGNTEQLLGIFAHNIYVTLAMEFGIVGSVLFFIFILYSICKSKGQAIYVWLPIFISGISLFGAYSPFLFILNALIYNEVRAKGEI
ncbi:hypothetical protein SedNR2807_17540 [Citrobacter sedlakii]